MVMIPTLVALPATKIRHEVSSMAVRLWLCSFHRYPESFIVLLITHTHTHTHKNLYSTENFP
jgi:hypothetical protein